MTQIIDGKFVASQIRIGLKEEAEYLFKLTNKKPGLAAILVGDNSASKIYVNSKTKACNEVGFHSVVKIMDSNTNETELLDTIKKFNSDDEIDGILVQLPLPKHIDEDKIIEAISPQKDVDGFHPISFGKLVIGKETFYPCTPFGIMELLKYYKIDTKGMHVVVVGRSNIVGKPIANMLVQKKEGANAIVTICHTASPDISYYTKQADILIAAVGKANMITQDMVKAGVVIIDVGINRIEDASSPKGYKVVGDVDFENVKEKSSFITPVPGGVGPMTIAMLLTNTLKSFKQKMNIK
ncbi:MAG: bifunctional methylenetetrahydrofolate dehydrogenase/methenyltetrahydrofolate cyclohydrolase FolD [Ignavibacteriaceae bacterium]|jgi:methylenetetrahydrofolate dehydrogenase (NADP+)/methenyltetrahydrofolate cyclohydrolase|nr:bifunctional methylenetetrahydrofolate dehydrogenase/methenyltetrahydrofolate cyclohydrolase FolD [Ignavibacteriaceae bacterium]